MRYEETAEKRILIEARVEMINEFGPDIDIEGFAVISNDPECPCCEGVIVKDKKGVAWDISDRVWENKKEAIFKDWCDDVYNSYR